MRESSLSESVNVCPMGKHDDPEKTGVCIHCGADPNSGPRIVYVGAALVMTFEDLLRAFGNKKEG